MRAPTKAPGGAFRAEFLAVDHSSALGLLFEMSPALEEHKRSETVNVRCRLGVGDDPAQLSDTGLIVAVARGAHDALHEAYLRHGAPVHALARRVCSLSADEVTQEVFLRLWQEPGRFEPGRGSLRTFLLTDAHHRAVDLVRSNTARNARESAEYLLRMAAGMDVEDTALARLAADDVWRLLSALDGGQRAAIVLAYFGGYTYREVADLLEQPEGTIKSRIRNGLARLRQGLSGFTDQEDDGRSRAGGRGSRGTPLKCEQSSAARLTPPPPMSRVLPTATSTSFIAKNPATRTPAPISGRLYEPRH